MLVSVVVPVYNTAQYLHQCMDSLINQTLKEVEFIFVDDGSTDDSYEILEKYREKDDRIKIIRQENQYAGVARNNGMKQATGKYIIFLDSDDYFDLTLLEKTLRCAERNQAEIVFFGHYHYDNQTGVVREFPFFARNGIFSGEMLGENLFTAFSVVPWNKLYLRTFLTKYNMEYQGIYKHNDVYFGSLAVALAKRIVCLNERLVYHRINNKESLQGRETITYPYMIQWYTALKQSLIKHGVFEGEIKRVYSKKVCHSIECGARLKTEEILSKTFYSEMKKNLFPNLFDSPEDITKDAIIPFAIYESTDYDGYVLLLVERLKNRNKDMISKESKDYILGHAILKFPRRIKNVIGSIKKVFLSFGRNNAD